MRKRMATTFYKNLSLHVDKTKDGNKFKNGNETSIQSACSAPLRRHEKCVEGEFIDPSIAVGFKYTVRLNGTASVLFDGKSEYIHSITETDFGTQKAIKFKCNEKNSIIWSNDSTAGYAFAINILEPGQEFKVFQNNKEIGSAVIESVCEDQEIITSNDTAEGHVKEVQVNFTCRFILSLLKIDFISDVAGIATVIKACNENKAVTSRISALLLPSGKILVLNHTS